MSHTSSNCSAGLTWLDQNSSHTMPWQVLAGVSQLVLDVGLAGASA